MMYAKMESTDFPGLEYLHVELLQPYHLARDLAQRGQLLTAYIILDWVLAYGFECPKWRDELKKIEDKILNRNPRLKRSKRLFHTSKHSKASLDARMLSFLIPHVKETQQNIILEMAERIQDPGFRIPLLINCAAQWGELGDWVQCMNQYLSLFHLSGCLPSHSSSCRRLQGFGHILQDIDMQSSGGEESLLSRGLVTVIMSTYNAEASVGYAIKSILEQSYFDIELVIVDDASVDRTADVIADCATKDSRIVPVFLEVNSGPYKCRNVAIERASGIYITTHDSDDLCHPQRIRMQVEFLRAQPHKVAVIGQWLRIRPHGHILYHNKRGGAFLHGGLASMMYRKDVISRIGCYDDVRYSADTEYLFRLRRVFGSDSVASLRFPLVLAAFSDTSLTGCAVSRADSFFGDCESRSIYRSAWQQWHAETDPRQLFVRADSAVRMFPAPEEMRAPRDLNN